MKKGPVSSYSCIIGNRNLSESIFRSLIESNSWGSVFNTFETNLIDFGLFQGYGVEKTSFFLFWGDQRFFRAKSFIRLIWFFPWTDVMILKIFSQKNGRFWLKTKLIYEKIDLNMFFFKKRKTPIFVAEYWRKSQKNVILTSTLGPNPTT
jgi:hypothetical protein